LELRPTRDLIQDELGNYYSIQSVEGDKITLVNAITHSAFRRILSDDFVEEVRKKYNENVAVGQYFQDALQSRIKGLQSGKYPGGIYRLVDVMKEYKVELSAFYVQKTKE